MKPFFNYIPTKLHFGAGQLEQLGSIPLPGKKALIVITSGRSMRSSGTLDRVEKLLARNHAACAVYDKVQANPTREQVMDGAAFAKQEKCDFVVGLGGGSPIDAAKAIAVMATNPGDYWDYISGGTGKALPLQAQPLPIVAITTTAGTGTEVDPWTVVTNGNEKIGFGAASDDLTRSGVAFFCAFPAGPAVRPVEGAVFEAAIGADRGAEAAADALFGQE